MHSYGCVLGVLRGVCIAMGVRCGGVEGSVCIAMGVRWGC